MKALALFSVTNFSSFCDNLLDIFVTNINHYFDLLDFVYVFIRIYT